MRSQIVLLVNKLFHGFQASKLNQDQVQLLDQSLKLPRCIA